jgi:hypothetical protein
MLQCEQRNQRLHYDVLAVVISRLVLKRATKKCIPQA